MYTNRRTFVIKHGHYQEAIDLFKAAPTPPDRMSGSRGTGSGPFDSLIAEWDHENLTAYESSFTAMLESPEFMPWQNKVSAITETGGINEILYRFI